MGSIPTSLTINMKPIDALWKAIIGGFVSSKRHEPGVIIESLPKEIREDLKELKSDDIKNVRYEKYIAG